MAFGPFERQFLSITGHHRRENAENQTEKDGRQTYVSEHQAGNSQAATADSPLRTPNFVQSGVTEDYSEEAADPPKPEHAEHESGNRQTAGSRRREGRRQRLAGRRRNHRRRRGPAAARTVSG